MYSGGPLRQIALSHRPARLHRLAEFIPWNRFLGSINVWKYRLRNRFQEIDSVSYVFWRAGSTNRHRLAESIPWKRFLGSINVYKFWLQLPVQRRRHQTQRGQMFPKIQPKTPAHSCNKHIKLMRTWQMTAPSCYGNQHTVTHEKSILAPAAFITFLA